jgi:hypothetical protein
MGSIITAGTTRTQAGATLITADVVTCNTSTANSGTTYVGDGVCLPQIESGTDKVFFINNTANWVQVYGYLNPNGSYDSINGIAGSQGVAISPYSTAVFVNANPGNWECGLDAAPIASYNANSATAAATLSAANITGASGVVHLALNGTLTAAANAQLPTVAAMLASLPAPSLGTSYKLRVINNGGGAFTWTLTTNTGWTLNGTMGVANGTWREYVITVTALGASPTATIQEVGGSTTV